MEFQIDVKDFKDQGTALLITKWLNLGAGLTPLDPKWRNHHAVERQFVDEVRLGLPLGSIRSSFERQEGLSLESLT